MNVVTKIVCILVAFMVVVASTTETAIQCNDMTLHLKYCLSYLKGGPGPDKICCARFKVFRLLNAMALTPQDRHAACECLKSFLGSIPGLIETNAAALPDKCNASFPYPISPKTDCSKAH